MKTEAKPGDSRITSLESALARTALALHMQHLMVEGPSWDECPHPLCAEARRLLPNVRLTG